MNFWQQIGGVLSFVFSSVFLYYFWLACNSAVHTSISYIILYIVFLNVHYFLESFKVIKDECVNE